MKALLFLSVAIILSGIAGVIGHSVSFNSQNSNWTNTYKTAWFAGVFAMSGLYMLLTLRKAHLSKREFCCEIFVILWLFSCSFISLVCLGYSQDWLSFSWVFVTFVPVISIAIFLIKSKNGTVSDETKIQTTTSKVIGIVLVLLKGIFLFILSLLAAGSISAAIASSYPAPGRPVSVLFDGAGRNGTLQLYCIGTSNVSMPTIFIFSSAAHGIVDFYGLQYYLSTSNGTNRRVCTHDPLGFGWSQDPFTGQFSNYEYLYRLMVSSGESSPWHVVGWGGGGSAAMFLANNYTSSIKSVTFIETYPPGIEFNYYGYQNGLGQQAISDYRLAQLSSRMGLSKLILSIAIPWGLMSLFFPISPHDKTYYPQERWPEFRVQMWQSKVWISQYQGLEYIQNTADSQDPLISFAPLPSQIPVFGVYCNLTASCDAQTLNGGDCTEYINKTNFYNSEKFSMLKLINTNATIAENLEIDCGLSLPVSKPLYTALSILKLYSAIEP